MPDDPRIKRLLKRYRKGDEFSDSTMDLTGLPFEVLQGALRCGSDNLETTPRELDNEALTSLAYWMHLTFDPSTYDYFIHGYARREFCSPDRIPPEDLHLPCEDGPPKAIPLEQGLHWCSSRPEEGQERFIGVEDE